MADQKEVIQHAQDDLKTIGPDVAAQPQKGLWDRFKDWMIDKFAPEAGEMMMQKVAQGAAEISQALNSQSNAYVPYGHAQQPLEVERPGMSYQDHLRQASERGVYGREKELER